MGEFQLTVGAQIFVAEAARNLEVAFNTGDHEQLLELLRTLGQRIKFMGAQPAGDNKVARPFRRTLEQDRRLDLQEVAVGEIFANKAHKGMAQSQIAHHVGAAQIQITVFQPQRLIDLVGGVGNIKGWIFSRVQDRHLVGHHLNRAGAEVGILLAGGAGLHKTLHLHDKFAARLFGKIMRSGIGVGIDGHLGNTKTVAEIQKDQPAMIAPPVNPAGQCHLLPDMAAIQFTTTMAL